MNYFTKEELEDITNELVASPTRETLNKLNEKYNPGTTAPETLVVNEVPNLNAPSTEGETLSIEPAISNTNPPSVDIPVVDQASEPSSIPITEMPIPSLEVPNLNETAVPSQTQDMNSANPLPVGENPWDAQTNQVGNMMQTTDNFNATSNTPSPETVASAMKFVGMPEPTPASVPNQNVAPMPTMFGQLEQNYM